MDNESKPGNGEHSAQISLDSLTDMATRMGHPTVTMEIIGIATPEDAEALQQKTSEHNNVLTLPDKQAIKKSSSDTIQR